MIQNKQDAGWTRTSNNEAQFYQPEKRERGDNDDDDDRVQQKDVCRDTKQKSWGVT